MSDRTQCTPFRDCFISPRGTALPMSREGHQDGQACQCQGICRSRPDATDAYDGFISKRPSPFAFSRPGCAF